MWMSHIEIYTNSYESKLKLHVANTCTLVNILQFTEEQKQQQ